MVVQTAIDERQEHKARSVVKDLLMQFQKGREEEEKARGLIEEMQRNLDEAQPELPKQKGNWVAWSVNTFTPMKKKWSPRTASWTRCGR